MSQTPAASLSAPAPPSIAEARADHAARGVRRSAERQRVVRGRTRFAWRRWAREVAVIAAGALAALGGQAWWQDRQDRERERDYLRHLLADARENLRRIDRVVAADSASEQTTRRVAAFLYDGDRPPPDTLAAWFVDGGVFSSSAFQPLTGTYATLLATGDLRLVRDEALRGELVAYAARVESERAGGGFTLEALGDAGRIVRTFPFMRRLVFMDAAQVRAEARRFPFARLRHDPDATPFLFALEVARANRMNHLRTLRRDTQRLRERLEALGADPEARATPASPPR